MAQYSPPGVYTQTNQVTNVAISPGGTLVPVLMGTGSELLSNNGAQLVRGSSATQDQQVVNEDETGRAVVLIADSGAITLGDFDGTRTKLQVRNYPVTNGSAVGVPTNDQTAVTVLVNGSEVVVRSLVGQTGVIELAAAPEAGAVVTVTYFFDRADTQLTDDVSDQVTQTAAEIVAQVGGPYVISAQNQNNLFVVTSDRAAPKSYTIPDGTYTAASLATYLNTNAPGSLVFSSIKNYLGLDTLKLSSDESIVVGSGTLNSTLGLNTAQTTARNSAFRTFQGPIVTGTGGGITTTSVLDVTVTVDGVAVTPSSVDGANRLVTLPFAPAVGSTVEITYWWNSWQDTFDYLPSSGVTDITECGDAPGLQNYIEDADFILHDDKIVWGSAALVEAGETATGSTGLDTKVTVTLIDDKTYMTPATEVSGTGRTQFQLAFQPTTGNGRDTPLGSSLYGEIANGRLDLPTNRPDLVTAYWGFGVEDALARGAVTVLSVESETSTITLRDPVPAGATVFATFWYNRLGDGDYTLTSSIAGPSGVGSYTITSPSGTAVLSGRFGVKGSSLTGVVVQTPSGSEKTIDVRHEGVSGSLFRGPVEETVTVTFADTPATLAEYTVAGVAPYAFVSGASDRLGLELDGTAVTVDLGSPSLTAGNLLPTYVGHKVSYQVESGTDSYEIDSTNNTLSVELDGVTVTAVADSSANATVANYVSALNRATHGERGTAPSAGSTTTFVLAAGASSQDDYYNGWTLTFGGTYSGTYTVTDYDGTTKVCTLDTTLGGNPGTVAYRISNPLTRPILTGDTVFDGPVVITANERDDLLLSYVGDITGTEALSITLAAASYADVTALATELQSKITNAVSTAIGDDPTLKGLSIWAFADSEGRLVLSLDHAYTDSWGYLSVSSHTEPQNFATLAGFRTGIQVMDIDVARRDTSGSGPLLYDRLVLRNRLFRGVVEHDLSKAAISILAGSGNEQAGLVEGTSLPYRSNGCVIPALLTSSIGFDGGQQITASDAGDGMPVVTFYSGDPNNADNNVLKLVVDGTTYTTVFAAGETPIGPASLTTSVVGTILDQNPTLAVSLYGAGLLVQSATSSEASQLVVGNGSANQTLGFVEGQTAARTLVSAQTVASALMNNAHSSLAGLAANTISGTAFAGLAVATVSRDADGNDFLSLQSSGTPGTTSSIEFVAVTPADALSYGTNIGVSAGDGSRGDAAISGFFVTSSDPNGSGSANNSVLNPTDDGTGQDGVVGQTYRDLVTGLTFTVLPRAGGTKYPTGSNAFFTLVVSQQIPTDANIPIRAVPGLECLVQNTQEVTVQNTALVRCFARGGEEPAVGASYYVSYRYRKQNYDLKLYTSLSEVEAEFGPVSPQNQLSLAAYLVLLNGATNVAIKQVRTTNGTASDQDFRAALDSLEGTNVNGIRPGMIIPITAPSIGFLQYLTRHCQIQSSKAYGAERTALVGLGQGINPVTVRSYAQLLRSDRMRIVYPDSLRMPLQDALGRTREYLVDGYFAAAALAGSVVSPLVDVATPWDRRLVRGFTGLGRNLSVVEANQVAVSGVTVLEVVSGTLRVRQGLTTDMTNILTKTPTVALIADEVQVRLRAALDPYIGQKFLPGLLSRIEGVAGKVLQTMQKEGKLAGYEGVIASVDPLDPSVCNLVAQYAPIFPLLKINATLSLRSTLNG